MTRPSPRRPEPPEYKEYCRCWWIYLRRIIDDRTFTERLRSKLPRGTTVYRWPTVWPSVEYMFSGDGDPTARFVEAVRHAERSQP